jgi:hypothetical protein
MTGFQESVCIVIGIIVAGIMLGNWAEAFKAKWSRNKDKEDK